MDILKQVSEQVIKYKLKHKSIVFYRHGITVKGLFAGAKDATYHARGFFDSYFESF